MGKYVAEQTVKQMIQNGHNIKGADVIVLGLTFKENCPDLRNSKVIDVIRELKSYGCTVRCTTRWPSPPRPSTNTASASPPGTTPARGGHRRRGGPKQYSRDGRRPAVREARPERRVRGCEELYDPAALEAAGAGCGGFGKGRAAALRPGASRPCWRAFAGGARGQAGRPRGGDPASSSSRRWPSSTARRPGSESTPPSFIARRWASATPRPCTTSAGCTPTAAA